MFTLAKRKVRSSSTKRIRFNFDQMTQLNRKQITTPNSFTLARKLMLLTITLGLAMGAELPRPPVILTTLKDNAVPGYQTEWAPDGMEQAADWHSKMGKGFFRYTFATLDPTAKDRFAPGKNAVAAIIENQKASGTYVCKPEEIHQHQYRFHQIPEKDLQGPVLEATWENVVRLIHADLSIDGVGLVADSDGGGSPPSLKDFDGFEDCDSSSESVDDLIDRLAAELQPHSRPSEPQQCRSLGIRDAKTLRPKLGGQAFHQITSGEFARTRNGTDHAGTKAWRNWVELNLQAVAHLKPEEKAQISSTWWRIEHTAKEFAKSDGAADKGAPIKIYCDSRWGKPHLAVKAALAEIRDDVEADGVEAWKIRAYLYCQAFYSNFAGNGYGLAFTRDSDTNEVIMTKGAEEYVFLNQVYPANTKVTVIDGDFLALDDEIQEPKFYSEISKQANESWAQSKVMKIEIAKVNAEVEKAEERLVRLKIEGVHTSRARPFNNHKWDMARYGCKKMENEVVRLHAKLQEAKQGLVRLRIKRVESIYIDKSNSSSPASTPPTSVPSSPRSNATSSAPSSAQSTPRMTSSVDSGPDPNGPYTDSMSGYRMGDAK